MRKMRIEIAVAALMMAPLLGYAIGYFVAGGGAHDARPAAAAASDRPVASVRDGELDT